MSTKLKKYLFLIPTIFVMLINCVCYGQVIAADDTTFPVFLEPSEFALYDFSDVDTLLSDSHLSSGSKAYYFTCAFMSSSDYNNFLSGGDYSITLYMFYPKSFSDYVQNDDVIMFKISQGYKATFKYTASSDTFNTFDTCSGFSGAFYYDKTNGSVKYDAAVYSLPTSLNVTSFLYERYYFFQGSNIPDFPLVHDYSASQSALNVDVVFNPELSGEVDRSVTLDDGSTALKNSITMVVYNHSKFDIQYKMDIYCKDDLSEFATVSPGVYPVFTYYEKDWVYGNSLDNNADFWNKTEKQNKATSQHLIWSGRSDIVSFNFSQLPLSEGVNYTVVVRATRNDYKFPSEIVADYLEEPDPGIYQVSQSEVVFRSDFSMKQYSDVKYDHSDNSNGVLPFQGKDDKQQYENSYYAKEDDSGNVDYEGKDVYNDPDSWYNDTFNDNFDPSNKWYDGLVGDKESGGSSDGTFTSFASSFTNYFQFLAYIFNYFPVGMKNVFLIGFVGIMAVVLLKVVFKS